MIKNQVTVNPEDYVHKDLLIEAFDFYISCLLPRKKIPIECDIQIEDISEDIKGDIKGDIYPESDYYVMRLHSDLNLRGMLSILAHECVHIKQYERREIKDLDFPYTLWKDKRYNINIALHKSPWEIDAIGLGDIIFQYFVNEKRLYDLKEFKDPDYL